MGEAGDASEWCSMKVRGLPVRKQVLEELGTLM